MCLGCQACNFIVLKQANFLPKKLLRLSLNVLLHNHLKSSFSLDQITQLIQQPKQVLTILYYLLS